ncbi:Gfo/Idh/MocA family oxidoreductase [Gammaproteobacteria bacterium]|nr:Gfo/Idh/MocA family oxidoreductase [Gammaproteobacteria bacterium]
MSKNNRQRLRFFESRKNQNHIPDTDRFMYKKPESQYRICVIGTGTMGQEHMRVAALLGRAQVIGIFDSQALSMEVAAENYKEFNDCSLKLYSSVSSACSDPDSDAIFICTPNFTHREILETAIDSGKPIFLEKPMATTLNDCLDIVKWNSSYKSFIQIGLQYRYKAQYSEAIFETLNRETIGDIKTIALSESRPPFLDKVGQWNKFNIKSGGTLLEKCCHYFDLINLLASSRPIRVYAAGGRAVNFRDFEYAGVKSDIDDHAFVIIEYASGVRANFSLNMFSPNFSEELVVVGEGGRLVAAESFNMHQESATEISMDIETGERQTSRHINLGFPKAIESSGHHGSTYFEHMAFFDRVEGKETGAATIEEGFWSIIVATAAQLSLSRGESVSIEEMLKQEGEAAYKWLADQNSK